MTRKKDSYADLLGRLIGLAGKNMKQHLGHNLARAGFKLTTEQIILLGILRSSEGVNQQWLTDHVPHDKTAVTRWLDVLEKNRLVVRVADRRDRRQNKIFLTDQGRQYATSVYPVLLQTEKDALKGVPAAEVEICKRVLKQVEKNLSE